MQGTDLLDILEDTIAIISLESYFIEIGFHRKDQTDTVGAYTIRVTINDMCIYLISSFELMFAFF